MRYLVLALCVFSVLVSGCSPKTEAELAKERAEMKEATLVKEKRVVADREAWQKEQDRRKGEQEAAEKKRKEEAEAKDRQKAKEARIAQIRDKGDAEKKSMAIQTRKEITPLEAKRVFRLSNQPFPYNWVYFRSTTDFAWLKVPNPYYAQNLARISLLAIAIQSKELELKMALDGKEAEIQAAIKEEKNRSLFSLQTP